LEGRDSSKVALILISYCRWEPDKDEKTFEGTSST
jgi:hypothetical protein